MSHKLLLAVVKRPRWSFEDLPAARSYEVKDVLLNRISVLDQEVLDSISLCTGEYLPKKYLGRNLNVLWQVEKDPGIVETEINGDSYLITGGFEDSGFIHSSYWALKAFEMAGVTFEPLMPSEITV